MNHRVSTLADTQQVAREFLATLSSLSPSGSTIVGLTGELGAGKSAFVKEVGFLLGVEEEIISPTYVILKRYNLKNGHWKFLIHIDLYRIDHVNELRSIRWEEVLGEQKALIMVEWPERAEGLFPIEATMVHLSILNENEREITISP